MPTKSLHSINNVKTALSSLWKTWWTLWYDPPCTFSLCQPLLQSRSFVISGQQVCKILHWDSPRRFPVPECVRLVCSIILSAPTLVNGTRWAHLTSHAPLPWRQLQGSYKNCFDVNGSDQSLSLYYTLYKYIGTRRSFSLPYGPKRFSNAFHVIIRGVVLASAELSVVGPLVRLVDSLR